MPLNDDQSTTGTYHESQMKTEATVFVSPSVYVSSPSFTLSEKPENIEVDVPNHLTRIYRDTD